MKPASGVWMLAAVGSLFLLRVPSGWFFLAGIVLCAACVAMAGMCDPDAFSERPGGTRRRSDPEPPVRAVRSSRSTARVGDHQGGTA